MKYEYNLLYTLDKILNELPKAERIVAEYILNNSENVTNMNIHELSESCKGTPSAVTRLCKRINVKGYSHLRLQIMAELSRITGSNIMENIGSSNPEMEITHSIIGKSIETLTQLESLIDIKKILKTTQVLTKSNKIDIYGIGASSLVAKDFGMKLVRIGIPCSFYESEHLQVTSACSLTKSDAVLAISFSGETSDIIKATKIAKDQGAKIISITSNVATTLGELSDIALYVPVSEKTLRTGAMSSRIAQLTLIDILYYYITQVNPDDTIDKLLKTRTSLAKGN